jgi:hypothetical protein
VKKPNGLPKIRCECGDEILVLPDLKEMGKAIDDHVNMHLQNLRSPSCTPIEAECLKDALIAQVLNIVSQINDTEDQ